MHHGNTADPEEDFEGVFVFSTDQLEALCGRVYRLVPEASLAAPRQGDLLCL